MISKVRDLIRLKGVNFRFRGSRTPVLKDINMSIQEGDRILLRGDSGNGKSTLLQILAGLAPEYTAGELTGVRELFYSVKGVVLQNPEAQIVTPTVEEETAFALENMGFEPTKIRSRIAETLDRLGIAELAGRHPLTLSGGECQRVSLAAALALQPDILFLDEPTAFLDDDSSRRFFESLSLLPTKTAVVIVEHKVRAAAQVCSRSYEVSKEGCLKESDFQVRTILSNQGSLSESRDTLTRDRSDPALRIHTMSHKFDAQGSFLFSGISFSLAPGETVALMGPSGCGKTTMLSKIARIIPCGAGTVFFSGQDTFRMKKRRFHSQFHFVPQNPEHMFLTDTAREELELSGADAFSLCNRFGLEHRYNSNPFRLSEGEKRRLNLCSALAEARTVCLMDEPTYGLDDPTREALVQDIRNIAEKGTAVLFVTHDTDFAQAAADRILYLKDGILAKKENMHVETYKTA